jgi:predicted anti-sigma-YlaC factor YlaD
MKDTNMKCNRNDIRELLPDLAAGLAPAAPEATSHLAMCGECAGMLAEFRKTMSLLDEWQSPEPSPYFDVRLHARLREEAAKQPANWFAWMRRPAIAVTMAVALVAGVTVWMGRQGAISNTPAQPGTAVSDLQSLDNNLDMFTDPTPDSDSPSDLLDDLQVQQDVRANP